MNMGVQSFVCKAQHKILTPLWFHVVIMPKLYEIPFHIAI